MWSQTTAARGRGQPVRRFFWALVASLVIAGYFLAFFLSVVCRPWMDTLDDLSQRLGWYTVHETGPWAMGYWGPLSTALEGP